MMKSRDPMRPPKRDRDRGIALAIVLVLIVLLITSVYAFSRRAVINVTITQNRLTAAQADALARGGLRMAEAIVYLVRLQEQAVDSGGSGAGSPLSRGLGQGPDPWSQVGDFPIELEGDQSLRITIEETSGRLNLNALVPQKTEDQDNDFDRSRTTSDDEEALEYLVLVLRHIIDGIDASAEEKNYDERAIAQNLIDYTDADDTALNGRSEDDYYARQDPPYRPRNGPLLSFEEIGLVEGVDPLLLEAMRDYLTVHPIGGRSGIDLNRAEPWVLPLVYSGPSGDRELLRERTVRQILALRKRGKIVCTDVSKDPENCVTP
ncbi:MAG: hypothetical protein V3T64_04740, partial [Myxococcota bacterium]